MMFGQTYFNSCRPFHTIRRAMPELMVSICLLTQAVESASAKPVADAQHVADMEAAQLAQTFIRTSAIDTSCNSIRTFNKDRLLHTSIVREKGVLLDAVKEEEARQVKRTKTFLEHHKNDDSMNDTIALRSWDQLIDYIESGKYLYFVCHVDGTRNIPEPQHVAYLHLSTRPMTIYFSSQVYSRSYGSRRPTGFTGYTSETQGSRYTYDSIEDIYATGYAHIDGTRSVYIELIRTSESWDWLKDKKRRSDFDYTTPSVFQ